MRPQSRSILASPPRRLAALVALAAAPHALAQAWTENFNAQFDHPWTASPGLPEQPTPGGDILCPGPPTFAFETLGPEGVLRLTTPLPALTRRGWTTTSLFAGDTGWFEVRFNTLAASPLAGPVEFWIVDAVENDNWVLVRLMGGPAPASRKIVYQTSAGESVAQPLPFADDTWYRLRFEFTPTQLSARALADDATTVLAEHTYAQPITSLGAAYRLGLSQVAIDAPGATPDVAIDRVASSLCGTPAFFSRPANARPAPGCTASFMLAVGGSGPLALRWRKNGVPLADGPTGTGSVISGAATGTLTISNVGPADQGNYALLASGPCGELQSNSGSLVLCQANCDCSTGTPVLSPADFACFLSRFRAKDPYANCDGSTAVPIFTPADFVCFLNQYRAGC